VAVEIRAAGKGGEQRYEHALLALATVIGAHQRRPPRRPACAGRWGLARQRSCRRATGSPASPPRRSISWPTPRSPRACSASTLEPCSRAAPPGLRSPATERCSALSSSRW
jgi:hypothetical protein